MKSWIPTIAILLCLGGVAYAVQIGGSGNQGDEFPAYTRHHDFNVGALASVGAGAPVGACCGSVCGLGLDNVNEILAAAVEVPSEWDNASDMTIHVHIVPTDSDPVADTEDIDIDFEWRSIDPTSETGKTGTAVILTDTYLQSGAGTECEVLLFSATVPYTGGNQPLTVDDDIVIKINRNPGTEANSYSGSVILYKTELIYTATGKGTH